MSDRPMTDKQMYDAYVNAGNPAMRDWYAKTLARRAELGSSEAKRLAAKTHINKGK